MQIKSVKSKQKCLKVLQQCKGLVERVEKRREKKRREERRREEKRREEKRREGKEIKYVQNRGLERNVRFKVVRDKVMCLQRGRISQKLSEMFGIVKRYIRSR